MEPKEQLEPRRSLDIYDGYITGGRDDVESQQSGEEIRQQANPPQRNKTKIPTWLCGMDQTTPKTQ